jgi:hypothetical protein
MLAKCSEPRRVCREVTGHLSACDDVCSVLLFFVMGCTSTVAEGQECNVVNGGDLQIHIYVSASAITVTVIDVRKSRIPMPNAYGVCVAAAGAPRSQQAHSFKLRHESRCTVRL